jgi:hypothetical protein
MHVQEPKSWKKPLVRHTDTVRTGYTGCADHEYAIRFA